MRPFHVFLAIAVVVFLVYGRTLRFDFTRLDDDKLIVEHEAFLRDPSNVVHAFQRDVFGTGSPAYRPLLTLSFMLDVALGGESPRAYHVSNVVIHVLAAMCIFLVLRALGYAAGLSLWASLVFAVHPLLTPAVAWIPGRNDSLLALFVLSAFLAFAAFMRNGTWWSLLLHVVLFAAALFTKETALALPVMCLLYVALMAREQWRRIAVIGASWLVAIAGWWAIRASALAGAREASATIAALQANARAALELLGAIFFPPGVSVYPVFSIRATLIGILAAILVVATAAIADRERRPRVLFGVLWFIVFLLPTLVVRDPGVDFDYLDHRAYLPFLGIMIVVLEFLSAVRIPMRVAIGAAVVIILAVATVFQSRHFKDAITFWTRAVHDAPRSAEARYSLGNVQMTRGDFSSAASNERAAIELLPNDPLRSPKYHLTLGLVYEAKGMSREAERKYRDALAVNPNFGVAHCNLGTIHFKEGRLDDAEAEYRQAISVEPKLALAYVNLCALRYQQNRFAEAEAFCRKALEFEKDSERARLGLVSVHYSQGRYEEAIRELDELEARGVAVDELMPGIRDALRPHRK